LRSRRLEVAMEAYRKDNIFVLCHLRTGEKKLKIQKNWQHRVHKMKTNKTKSHICWTPLYENTNNVNKT
jgi:hypothetical protein